MTDVKDKHIAIIGGARSGLAAARMLKERGAEIFLSDSSELRPDVKAGLENSGIAFEEKHHSVRARQVDMAVVSPGVPDHIPLMKFYSEADVPVYSELEAASWFNNSPVIAVTGSNGKTTVTSWLAHTFKTAGKPCLLAGNIGLAFSDVVGETAPETAVILEVSSFQLDHIHSFRPDAALLLNITPDHLDRYNNNFEHYIRSKMRIAENQLPGDRLLYNADDPVLTSALESYRRKDNGPQLLAWSAERELEQGAFIRNGEIILKINDKEEPIMQAREIGLPGRHNLNNGLATALAARVSEIQNEAIRESLMTFEGVEHRLEMVAEIGGVRYINDSKATNINAVWYALDSFNMPIVLILGGRDKGNDYLELEDQIRENVHTVIAIGEARAAIREQLQDVVPNLIEANNMKEAVLESKKAAKRGEIVLLSPACASFDMFEDYEHRGQEFKKAVLEL